MSRTSDSYIILQMRSSFLCFTIKLQGKMLQTYESCNTQYKEHIATCDIVCQKTIRSKMEAEERDEKCGWQLESVYICIFAPWVQFSWVATAVNDWETMLKTHTFIDIKYMLSKYCVGRLYRYHEGWKIVHVVAASV